MAKIKIIKIMSDETFDLDYSIEGFLTDKGLMYDGKMTIKAIVRINKAVDKDGLPKYTSFDDWVSRSYKDDDYIEYQILAGDPGTSAAIGSTIAAYFQAAVALYKANAIFAAVVNAVASLTINKIISHFTKRPDPVKSESRGADSVYSFSGGQNSIAVGQPKALLHGERKGFYPEIPHSDLVYISYEDGEFVNNNPNQKRSNQILNMLLFVATGDCAVTNVTLEDTKFDSLKNSTYEVIPPSGDISDFYRLISATELSDVELPAWNEDGGTAAYGTDEGWVGNDTGIVINPQGTKIDGIYASVEFSLGKGSDTDASVIHPLTASAEIQYAEVDKNGDLISSWANASSKTSEINFFNSNMPVTVGVSYSLLGVNTYNHVVKVFYSYQSYHDESGSYNIVHTERIITSYSIIETDGENDSIIVNSDSLNAGETLRGISVMTYGYVVKTPLTESITNTGADLTPYTREVFFPVQKGRYAIRARRIDQKDLSVTARHQIRLVGIKGRNTRSYDNSDCTLINIRLQASKQLSSQTSNKIKVDAHYKNSSGGIENRASVLIKRIINGDEGVEDPNLINANYDALDDFGNVLLTSDSHINCRLTSQMTINDFLDDILSELRSAKYIKSARLEFAREKYPTIPEATFTADKVIMGSLKETFNLANENKAGVIVAHYWNNEERRVKKIKLKPQGSRSDIEIEIQFKYLNNEKDVIRQLYYIAQNNLLRVIPNTISIGAEGLDLKPSSHINIELPRISESQSVQIRSHFPDSKLVELNVTPLVKEGVSYVLVVLDRFNKIGDVINITGFDNNILTLQVNPETIIRTNLSEGNSTRALVHEVDYVMERRLVEDIQLSNSDNKIICELTTVDDYPEVHEGKAEVWLDDSPTLNNVEILSSVIQTLDWNAVINYSNGILSWDEYPLDESDNYQISGYELTTVVTGYETIDFGFGNIETVETFSPSTTQKSFSPSTDSQVLSTSFILKVNLINGLSSQRAYKSLTNPNYVSLQNSQDVTVYAPPYYISGSITGEVESIGGGNYKIILTDNDGSFNIPWFVVLNRNDLQSFQTPVETSNNVYEQDVLFYTNQGSNGTPLTASDFPMTIIPYFTQLVTNDYHQTANVEEVQAEQIILDI